jgi:hypothetical protein
MKEYLVKYTLSRYVYHTKVITATSEGAMWWVMNAFPEATNITVISSVDLHYPT